jgi:tetratricopeptide (TPR) repeat protein
LCLLLMGLTGCAARRVAVAPPIGIWQDAAFDYRLDRVTETRATLFALEPEALASIASGEQLGFTSEKRLDLLLSQLYGAGGVRLAYNGGHSTGAMQTWRNRRGDCLSMTVLTYAAANALGLTAHMQNVHVPVVLDRHDGIEFVNEHVNVFIRNESEVNINGRVFRPGGIVIDFEPQVAARNAGDWLSETDILVRYYNNRAAEFLVQKDPSQAYAYYRAAIEADPADAAAFSNLAQLYMAQGQRSGAEQLLRHALNIGGDAYVPLRTLERLLTRQGRSAEAKQYADALSRLQTNDPYYWLGRGLTALREERLVDAIDTLERAALLTNGFEEVHYFLGLAYLRSGQLAQAGQQIVALGAINSESQNLATLSRKLQSTALEQVYGIKH